MNYNELLDRLIDQLKRYDAIHRKSIQPFTKAKIQHHFPDYQDEFDHEIIRETLLEHVGSLPIIATYLHPYIDESVDLGKALMMLAIHDIGELIVGDELTFTKSAEQGPSELDAAMSLLHDDHKAIYREMDQLLTNEAKFVKSIDKLAPDILDYLCGEAYSANRLAVQVGWEPEEAMARVRAKKTAVYGMVPLSNRIS